MKWCGDKRAQLGIFLLCGYLVLTSSCGGGTAQPAAPATELLVGVATEQRVLVFDASSNGPVDPLLTISNIPQFSGVAFDMVNNEMFVPDGNTQTATQTITVYPLSHGGNAQSTRTIISRLGATFPQAVAVDTVNDEVLLLGSTGNLFSIAAYPRNASGDTAPLRTIQGTAERVFNIAVDAVNDDIYVTSMQSILVFSRKAAGPVAPLRLIASDGSFMPFDIAVDVASDEIIATSPNFCLDIGSCRVFPKIDPAIIVFPRLAHGNVTPSRSISGPSTSLASPADIVVDPKNDELFVADGRSINVYSRTGNGDSAPMRSISSPSIPTAYSMTGLALRTTNK